MEPSKFERAKMGAMMGGAVGLCIGLVFGGVSILRNGPGSRGYVETLTRTMVSSTATFAFFMAIGSVIRSEEALAIDYASLDQNREKKNIWGQPMRFKTPPVVILQQQQQQK
ncbi:subunit of TIM23 translocase complex [Mortierella alpina]|nr:subunit of TIM23 translocase complex [Mortierella alpina]